MPREQQARLRCTCAPGFKAFSLGREIEGNSCFGGEAAEHKGTEKQAKVLTTACHLAAPALKMKYIADRACQ